MAKIGLFVEGSTYNIREGNEIGAKDSDRAIRFICRRYPKLNEDGTPAAPDVVYSVRQAWLGFWNSMKDQMLKDEAEALAAEARTKVEPIVDQELEK